MKGLQSQFYIHDLFYRIVPGYANRAAICCPMSKRDFMVKSKLNRFASCNSRFIPFPLGGESSLPVPVAYGPFLTVGVRHAAPSLRPCFTFSSPRLRVSSSVFFFPLFLPLLHGRGSVCGVFSLLFFTPTLFFPPSMLSVFSVVNRFSVPEKKGPFGPSRISFSFQPDVTADTSGLRPRRERRCRAMRLPGRRGRRRCNYTRHSRSRRWCCFRFPQAFS